MAEIKPVASSTARVFVYGLGHVKDADTRDMLRTQFRKAFGVNPEPWDGIPIPRIQGAFWFVVVDPKLAQPMPEEAARVLTEASKHVLVTCVFVSINGSDEQNQLLHASNRKGQRKRHVWFHPDKPGRQPEDETLFTCEGARLYMTLLQTQQKYYSELLGVAMLRDAMRKAVAFAEQMRLVDPEVFLKNRFGGDDVTCLGSEEFLEPVPSEFQNLPSDLEGVQALFKDALIQLG